MIRPGVEIQQEFASQTASLSAAPLLPTVIVGVNVQSVAGASAGDYTGTSLVFAYPNLEFGAVVDLSSVAVTLKNVKLRVLARATVDTTFTNDVATSSSSNFLTANVAPDDLFIATSGSISYTAKVLAVVSATELKLDRYLPFATASFKILRASSDLQVAAANVTADTSTVTVAASLAVGGLPIDAGNVFVSFDAVRTLTQNTLTEITTAAEITGKLGAPSLKNKLALGVQCAKGNTITPVYALAIANESPAAYLEAFDFLTNSQAGTDGIYTIVALTQDTTVASMLKQHVEQMADPVRSKFRTAIVNLPHPTEATVIQQTEVGSLTRASGFVTLAHPTASFSGVVNVGDYVTVSARTTTAPLTANAARAGVYRVLAVQSNGVLQLDSQFYTGGNGNYVTGAAIAADFAADSVDFKIIRVLDKAGQAQAIAETASSFGNRRIIYVTNATCTLTIGTADVQVPGYYLAAAIAGMSSGNQPHQGFTNLGLSGVKAVQFGNTYFKEDQMGLIAGSGGFLVEQRSPTALPTAFYQTTTDTSRLETKEYSITKTVDYFCIGLKAQLQRQIGIANVYAGTLAALANAVEAWHTYLKDRSFPLIGSPLLDAKLSSVVQDPLQRDTVIIVDDITVPTPLNRVRVRVRVAI
jgi:hypothetical protein